MMEIDQKKVLEALKLIRDICDKHECHNCPLGNEAANCKIREKEPSAWCLTHETSLIWRAFRI